MSIIGTVYEDVTTEVLGEIGTWQWLVTLISTVLMIPSIFGHYEDVHLINPSHVTCIPSDGHDVKEQYLCTYITSNSTEEINCTAWHIKLLWVIWVKKTWLVFCNDHTKQLSTTMICRLGLIFGFVIYGITADSIGRRLAIMCDVLLTFILNLVIVFCDSAAWFRLVLFLKSLFGSCTIYMGLVIICEVASNRWRTWLSLIVMSPRLFALVAVVPLANSAPNIETYSFIGCIFAIFNILVLRWLPESPQWLLYNRQIHAAEKLLYFAARKNGIKFSASFKIRPVNYRAYNCLDETATCFDIFATYNVRLLVLLSLIFWFLFYFVWGLLYLQVYRDGTLSKTLMAEVIVCLAILTYLTIFPLKDLPSKRWLIINVLITGTCTSIVTLFNESMLYYIPAATALSAGVTVHALILNLTPRYYGINVRATLFGFCHAAGQIGAIISYMFHIYRPMDQLAHAAVGFLVTLCLVGLCIMFPDVDNRELPDVLEDMDYFSELSKPLRWATQKTNDPTYEEVEMRVYSFGSARENDSDERSPPRRIGWLNIVMAWRWMTRNLRCWKPARVAQDAPRTDVGHQGDEGDQPG